MSIAASPPYSTLSEPVLILAHLQNDQEAIGKILSASQIPIQKCGDVKTLCERLPYCLSAVVTIEAVAPALFAQLQNTLREQPPWSDIPLILLTGRAVPTVLHQSVQTLGNVTLLERPLRPSSLISLVNSAVRARRRQWEVRDLLAHNQALTMELRRAMTETHHRIKNNLQLISALVDYQLIEGRQSVPASELQRIGMHIQTLATIHDILTYDTKQDGQGNNISSKAVLDRLLPLMQQTAGDRHIRFHIDDAVLPTRHGASLAILTNELISNALKYAVHEIEVVFAIRPPIALLTVRDDGPGFPPDFTPIGIGRTGLEIVTTLTRHDLNGDIRFENSSNGGGIVSMSFSLQ